MNAAMVLRGPDDEGSYVDERCGVAIGARRLSIIDVEGGHQPVCNEDRTVWAAQNGEIYNHPELQRHLRDKGHRLASGVDTSWAAICPGTRSITLRGCTRFSAMPARISAIVWSTYPPMESRRAIQSS